MPNATYEAAQVIPTALARAIHEKPFWFLVGGQAVRCLVPYRPSRDVDLGLGSAEQLEEMLVALARCGDVELTERADDTTHLRWNGINVSLFVLPHLVPFVERRGLNATGLIATKLHAILDRGARRDFFDLYVTLSAEQTGIQGCLSAIREVYQQDVNDDLLLRSLTFFDDADREAPLPGEGPNDWETVKTYFANGVAALIVPPSSPLEILARVVDVGAIS